MKKLRRVLVAIADLHHANTSLLRRAAALARPSGASLELFHAVNTPLTQTRRLAGRRVEVQLSIEHSVAAAQERLERLAHSRLLSRCKVHATASWATPAHEAIVRRAAQTGADLIISGTRTRGLANRLVLRHTDWELVRHTPVPLLLVKSQRPRRKSVVLAAIDPLHANEKPARLDEQILDAAQGMAKLLRGTVHALHAYMPLSITMAAGIGEPIVWNTAELDQEYSKQVRRQFSRILTAHRIPPRRRHLQIGAPAHELASCSARIGATLVVMGAVSRSRLERLMIGSTAERALDELACDVLIVRPRNARRASPAPRKR